MSQFQTEKIAQIVVLTPVATAMNPKKRFVLLFGSFSIWKSVLDMTRCTSRQTALSEVRRKS
jgi:hypothetical protein